MKNIVALLGLMALVALNSCSHHEEEEHHHHHLDSKFQVTQPMRDTATVTRDYVCQIHSVQHIEIRALEKGYLQEIYVDEGQHVKKGQLMFKIMPLLYQAEYEKAKAEANFAEIEYLNTKALADSNIVSANELALAKAKFDKANAELSLANVHLGFTEIRAPFDGIMDRFHVRLGSLIEEGELLTSLSDNSQMWVYFNVPEAEYLAYMKNAKAENGKEVRLKMANSEQFSHIGKISAIEADFDNTTGNIAFRATFDNQEGLLRHGETGNILMDSKLTNALLIPQKATFEVLDQRYVFVVGDDNKVHSTKIEVSAELPHLFVVSDGITENDKILLEGLRKVKNNDEIHFEFLEPKAVLSNLELYAE